MLRKHKADVTFESAFQHSATKIQHTPDAGGGNSAAVRNVEREASAVIMLRSGHPRTRDGPETTTETAAREAPGNKTVLQETKVL